MSGIVAAAPAPRASEAEAGGGGAMGRERGTPEEEERLAAAAAPAELAPLSNNNGKAAAAAGGGDDDDAPRSVFRSTRLFMLVFLSAWVMQGMFFTYFVSVITTIERLFRIESKTSGTLLAATEIGQICTALFLTYFAGRGHRPRWIAAMMLVLAAGVLGCVAPHVLYGTRLLDAHLGAHNASEPASCASPSSPLASPPAAGAACSRQQEHSDMTSVVMPWLFACLLVVGVGQTGIATLGIPYIDDNVGSRQSPLYMAITIGIRVIGPALGFLLGALCTRVYVDPLLQPDFGPDDPRWLGAWWLGMVLVASLIVLLSLLMFCFPRQIRAPPPSALAAAAAPLVPSPKHQHKSRALFKDFLSTIKRQLTNDILMCRTASSVLHLVPINGLYSFLPKYLETQFRLAPHLANLVSGMGGILVIGLGIITSGVVILKLVPTARQVAAWTAATALLYSAGMVTLMFVSCPAEELAPLWRAPAPGLTTAPTPAGLASTPACGAPCHCTNERLTTVCGQDGLTYLSACHAGCRGQRSVGERFQFYDCACVNSSYVAPLERLMQTENRLEELPKSEGGYAVAGECRSSCWQFYVFLVLFALVMFLHASGEVGSVLLIIRCTDPRDKAMAMGVIQFAIGVFGNVPCPIVFGAAVDAACYAKEALCGALGGCARYDNQHFRHYFLGLTAGIMFLAFIMDLLVWSKAGRIDINPEEPSAPAPHTLAPAPHTLTPAPHTDTSV